MCTELKKIILLEKYCPFHQIIDPNCTREERKHISYNYIVNCICSSYPSKLSTFTVWVTIICYVGVVKCFSWKSFILWCSITSVRQRRISASDFLIPHHKNSKVIVKVLPYGFWFGKLKKLLKIIVPIKHNISNMHFWNDHTKKK